MNQELTFKCIKCGAENRIQDSVTADYRRQLEAQLKDQLDSRDQALARREADIEANSQRIVAKEEELAAARDSIDSAVRQKLEAERVKVAGEERQRATQAAAAKVTALETLLGETTTKLVNAEGKELQLLHDKAALDEEMRKVELTVMEKLDAERKQIRAQAQQEAEALLNFKITEKEVLIDSLKKQAEELRRKLEQGSQQIQGEAQEVDLLDAISGAFRHDLVERVAKGQFGADILQQVNVTGGFQAGRILIESKRTKAWSDGWLEKAKQDQRDAKADLVLIVTSVMPKNVTAFECIDGVWVTSIVCALSVVSALRWTLIETATARFALQKRDSTMEAVYAYLTGGEFRARVRAIVENVMLLQDQINKERRFMERSWAEQAKQVERLTVAAAGMYGDLHGIIGSSLPQIDGLDVPMIEAGAEPPTAIGARVEEDDESF